MQKLPNGNGARSTGSVLKGSACMMPLVYADVGEEQIIKKVGGSQEMKQHLADMGFVPGGGVTVVSTIGGNVIVKVKESRVAISREMAQRIMV